MRVALIASPFISVPPRKYGGTELFVANLAEGLQRTGISAVVYSNGESTVKAENRWCYSEAEWPLSDAGSGMFKELDHVAWSIADAIQDCDVIHVNSAPAVTYSRMTTCPFVCTLHHPYEEPLARFYERYRNVSYTAISHHQALLHASICPRMIHHGLDLRKYRLQADKEGYLCFLGRIAPIKGTHLAVQVAQRAGIPLKIAGEIQPIFRDYYDKLVKPHVDGKFIEYVGEVGIEEKNRLLGGSMGMLFPIQWQEPFGLVLIEAMACGTPVFAFAGGAVREIVSEGISGSITSSVDEMVHAIRTQTYTPGVVRDWAETMFSVEAMVGGYVNLYRTILGQKTGSSKVSAPSPEEETAA